MCLAARARKKTRAARERRESGANAALPSLRGLASLSRPPPISPRPRAPGPAPARPPPLTSRPPSLAMADTCLADRPNLPAVRTHGYGPSTSAPAAGAAAGARPSCILRPAPADIGSLSDDLLRAVFAHVPGILDRAVTLRHVCKRWRAALEGPPAETPPGAARVRGAPPPDSAFARLVLAAEPRLSGRVSFQGRRFCTGRWRRPCSVYGGANWRQRPRGRAFARCRKGGTSKSSQRLGARAARSCPPPPQPPLHPCSLSLSSFRSTAPCSPACSGYPTWAPRPWPPPPWPGRPAATAPPPPFPPHPPARLGRGPPAPALP